MCQEQKVTFLGPRGATFSDNAYRELAKIYNVPVPTDDNFVGANKNAEILERIIGHGGVGAIAMETEAERRVAESLDSFMGLLEMFPTKAPCPIQVLGAVRLKLHFCLMARSGVGVSQITKVVAHPKSFGACRGRVQALGVETIEAPSNGEAARKVAEEDEFATAAAIGPISAAGKYGLTVLDPIYEDRAAATTFFLVGPTGIPVVTSRENRLLVIYRAPHVPDAYIGSLLPFKGTGLNFIQVYSIHVANGTYTFALEIEATDDQLPILAKAMEEFRRHVSDCLIFGPFGVHSK